MAAVPAPLPLGAALGGGHGVYVPVQLVGGACGKDLMVESHVAFAVSKGKMRCKDAGY